MGEYRTPRKEEGRADDSAVNAPLALMLTGLAAGAYAMAPAFYLGGLHVKRGAEIADHAIPGLVVLVTVLVAVRWAARSVNAMLACGVVIVVAGLWMVATHVRLFVQGVHHQAPWGPVAYHCSTALAVLALGLVWVWRHRRRPSGCYGPTC